MQNIIFEHEDKAIEAKAIIIYDDLRAGNPVVIPATRKLQVSIETFDGMFIDDEDIIEEMRKFFITQDAEKFNDYISERLWVKSLELAKICIERG